MHWTKNLKQNLEAKEQEVKELKKMVEALHTDNNDLKIENNKTNYDLAKYESLKNNWLVKLLNLK